MEPLGIHMVFTIHSSETVRTNPFHGLSEGIKLYHLHQIQQIQN